MRFFSLRFLRTPDGGRLDAAADSGQGVSLSESPGAGNAAPVFWERFGLLPGRPRAAVLLVCCPGLGVSERRFGNLNQRGGSGRQSLETLPPVAPRQALNSEARAPKQIFGRAPRPVPRQRQALKGAELRSFGRLPELFGVDVSPRACVPLPGPSLDRPRAVSRVSLGGCLGREPPESAAPA